MKKTILTLTLVTMSIFAFSQSKDWFGFNRYKTDNERIIESNTFPDVVFMGNSITDNWAYFHPDFFSDHNFCGRGISGQTSAQMLLRFQSDVVELHPKAVIIMAGTNDVAHNEYWVTPDQVVNNIVNMCLLAEANDIVPIIASIPPCTSFVWRPEITDAGQTIVWINEKLKDYSLKNNITYIDFHTALSDENLGLPKSLSEDGCHPNPDTYFTMEEMVMEAIQHALEK